MPDNNQNDTIELSRRKILGGIGTVGAAGLGAGLGANALFSDEETFTNNQLVAGELDMKAGWESHYSDWSEDEAEHAHMEDGELVVDDQQGFLNATLQQQSPMGGGNALLQQQGNGNATTGTSWDFGDAPDTPSGLPFFWEYPTRMASDGARHRDTSWAFFGASVTEEPSARIPNLDIGDDGLLNIAPLTFLVENEDWDGDLYVNALFDWAGNGSWEPYEQQTAGPLDPVPSDWIVQNMKIDGDVPPGTTEIFSTDEMLIPLGGVAGWLRLTLTSEPLSDYAGRGEFEIGETEDYLIGPGGLWPLPNQWFQGQCNPDPNWTDHANIAITDINLGGPSAMRAMRPGSPCTITWQVKGLPDPLIVPPIAPPPIPLLFANPPRTANPLFRLWMIPFTHDVFLPFCVGGWAQDIKITISCPPPNPFTISRTITCEFFFDHCDFTVRFQPVIEHIEEIENRIGVLETDEGRFEERLQEVESTDEVPWKRVAHLREQRNDLEERIADVDPWIDDVLEDVDGLKTFWNEIPSILTEHQARLSEIQDQIGALESDTSPSDLVDTLAEEKIEELAAVNDHHEEAIQEIEDSPENYESHDELIEDRESLIAENEETISELESRNVGTLITELEADEEDLMEAISRLQELDGKADDRSDELDDRTGAILARLNDLDAAVTDFEDRLDELFDPCEDLADVPDDLEKPVIDLADVKPGDFGMVTFDFLLCDNPGYVWLTGSLVDTSENDWTEPELDDPDEDGPPEDGGDGIVELLDAIQVQIWYDEDGDSLIDTSDSLGVGEEVFFEGTLSEALDALPMEEGIPLDGDRTTEYDELAMTDGAPVPAGGDDEARECFSASPTPHCIGFRWELPRDVGNAVQSDSVTFDLGLYTEQCRHNDGSGIDTDEDDDSATD